MQLMQYAVDLHVDHAQLRILGSTTLQHIQASLNIRKSINSSLDTSNA
jgi:hypothetical protein